MKIKRLWAQIHSNTKAFMVIVFLGLSAALPAGAQTITDWEYPGLYPFQGPPTEACFLLSGETELSENECNVGTARYRAGQCSGYIIEDGDIVTTTFTSSNGTHKARTVRVAFKYPSEHELAGKSLPLDHPSRRAWICSTGNKDNLAILLPDVCKNWSVHHVVPQRAPTGKLVCRKVPFSNPVRSGVYQNLNAFQLESCGNNSFTPSHNFYLNDDLQSSGYTEVCDWVQF